MIPFQLASLKSLVLQPPALALKVKAAKAVKYAPLHLVKMEEPMVEVRPLAEEQVTFGLVLEEVNNS